MTRKAFFIPDLLPFTIDAAREAGRVIMDYYRTVHAVDRKADNSPVTQADRDADWLIVRRLKALTPDIPIVSEEGDKPDVSQAETFWLVDPLDGTRSFVRGSGYFTVNIGLISHGVPVLGIIYDPVSDALYYGSQQGAFRQIGDASAEKLHGRSIPATGPVAIISHSHINEVTQNYLTKVGVTERIPCASSIKFCRLAEGAADIYPRFGPTSEWDTAAGHAILLAAGGSLTTPEGGTFVYGKQGFLNGNFVASAANSRTSPEAGR